MTLRIQIRRTKGFRKPQDAVVVARPSKWGNPFDANNPFVAEMHPENPWERNAALVDLHALWLTGSSIARLALPESPRPSPPTAEEIRRALAGKALACWCALCPAHAAGKPFDVECPNCLPCHADTLGKIAMKCEAA